MKVRLFVYGELLKKSSLIELIGRIPEMKPATLKGYKRIFDPKIGYYVAVKDENSKIEGKIIEGLEERELRGLDEYEEIGGLYDRKMEKVDVEGKEVMAFVYTR